MKGLSPAGDSSPNPMRPGFFGFDLNLLDVTLVVAAHSIEDRGISHRKQDQINVRLPQIKRRPIECWQIRVLGKPDGVRQTDQHLVMQPGKGFGAEEGVAKTARFLLDNVKDLRRIVAFGIILHNVGLLGRNDHADLLCAGSDHSLHQILGDRFGPFHTLYDARPHRQQLFGAAQRLDALPGAGGRNYSDHRATSWASALVGQAERASSKYWSNCLARTAPVWSSNVRSRA